MNGVARPKVLVSAYACGPNRVSEPAVGWNAVRQIAVDHDVWVLTSFENRDQINAAVGSLPGAPQFVFVDWPAWMGFVKWTRAGFEIQQYLWQIAAYFEARALHARIGFDVVHHVTLCRYWMPSFLPLLGVPFVWGPVGGGESAPKAFWRGLGTSGALLEVARECARFIGEHDPMLRLLAPRTSLAIATTDETSSRMQGIGVPHIEVMSQVALTEAELESLEHYAMPRDGAVRFLSIGRLVAWKGFHLGLHAFARVQDRTTEYWIAGDGPDAPALKALAARLGIASRVRFLGALPRPQIDAALQQCAVLIHPSLHDSGGAVCAEAMAAGRPVICLDLGGPGLQVTADTGIKVDAIHPEQAIRDLAGAMDRLSDSAELRAQLGSAGRLRVREHFTLDAKRGHFARWYRQAIGHSPLKAAEPTVAPAPPEISSASPRPVVSAVMPTYNSARYLQQAIDSVVNQTFQDWELIIVDDGSTDETASILARCTDPRIHVHTLPVNTGRAHARNFAVARATGRYIAICDSDDESRPRRFERQAEYLDTHPDIGIVSAFIQQTSATATARVEFPVDTAAIHRRFEAGKMGTAHGVSMIRVECFQRVGNYCEALRSAEDFELFRRFSQHYRFSTLPHVLLDYRNALGAVALRVWREHSCAHRYALYRSRRHGSSGDALTLDEFSRAWTTQLAVHTMDMLRFAQFNLRARLFSHYAPK